MYKNVLHPCTAGTCIHICQTSSCSCRIHIVMSLITEVFSECTISALIQPKISTVMDILLRCLLDLSPTYDHCTQQR